MFPSIEDGGLPYERGGTQKDSYGPDEVIEVPCPGCGTAARSPIFSEHESLIVSRCNGCGLIYTSTRIKEPERVYWGDGAKYFAEAHLIFEGNSAHHRDPNYLEEIRLVERYKPGKGRFLDVGCNMGMLMRLARKRGWEAVGVEPSPTLYQLAVEHNEATAYNCFLHELPRELEGSFDVVALSDVFEHITSPLEILGQARRFLKPDGVLFVKVPNAKWNLFKQGMLKCLGRCPRQGVWDSYEHVVHYTEATLRQMLDQGGFEPLRVAAMRPVQVPVWHHYVGHYYQYPSPWVLDWRRYSGRSACHYASLAERVLRLGSVGYLAQSLGAIARKS